MYYRDEPTKKVLATHRFYIEVEWMYTRSDFEKLDPPDWSAESTYHYSCADSLGILCRRFESRLPFLGKFELVQTDHCDWEQDGNLTKNGSGEVQRITLCFASY